MTLNDGKSKISRHPEKTGVTFGMWWIKQENGEYYIYQSPNTVDVLGREKAVAKPQKIFGDNWMAIAKSAQKIDPLFKQYHDNIIAKFNDLVSGKSDYCQYISPWLNLKKELIWIEDQMTVVTRDEFDKPLVIVGSSLDVTHTKKIEDKNIDLATENVKLLRAQRLTIKSRKIMVWFMDSEEEDDGDLFFYGNDFLIDKLGLTFFENNKFSIDEFNDSIFDADDEGKKMKEEYFRLEDKIGKMEIDSYERLIVKHQNLETKEIFYLEHNFEVEKRYPDGSLMIRGGYMNDVTAEVNFSKLNEFLINNDKMTGLRNRNSFEKFISSEDLYKKYSLLIADLDGLKFINDAFGHIMGDKAISYVSQLFIDNFSEDSELFRIGGDEFAIISQVIDPAEIEKRVQLVKDRTKDFYMLFNIAINISMGYEIVVDETVNFSEAFIDAENFMYRRKLNERNSRKSKTMETVLETLNQKTEETKDHCNRIGIYAESIMRKLGFNRSSDLDDMKLLCQFHDIGKITISEEILSKEGKLTHDEYEKIKGHSEAGYKIVRNIVESDRIALGVLYHHERVDGQGYPFGLFGDEIPLFAKILSICDSYDVMITGRKYSKQLSKNEAIDEIIRCRGTQFDESISDIFIEILKEKK